MVDVPDVVDNLVNEEERMELLNTKMKEVMLLIPGGIDALLYVPKYGNRITDEDLTLIIFLKVLFGQDFLKDRCILVLTGQDESEQFHSLKEECGNRVLLFDNMNEDIQRNQLENLVSQVAELRRNNFYKRYKDENFEKAKALRSEESKKEEKILTKVYGLLQTLKEPNGTYSQDKLLNLSSECGQVLLSIEEQDKDTGSLNEMKEKLKSLKTSLDKCWCLYSLNPDNIRERTREEKRFRC